LDQVGFRFRFGQRVPVVGILVVRSGGDIADHLCEPSGPRQRHPIRAEPVSPVTGHCSPATPALLNQPIGAHGARRTMPRAIEIRATSGLTEFAIGAAASTGSTPMPRISTGRPRSPGIATSLTPANGSAIESHYPEHVRNATCLRARLHGQTNQMRQQLKRRPSMIATRTSGTQ
jgi:hypothetical protein